MPVSLTEACGGIAVGDWVLMDSATKRFLRRLDRNTVIRRMAAGEAAREQVIAANIDALLIVSSCNQEFNLSRLERYLAVALESGAIPVVVLTKADLCGEAAGLRKQVERLHAGLVVETIDARCPEQAGVLEYWCRTGQTIALVGSSGVGKSTLANTLGVGHLLTATIREGDDKGRHTTTSRSMHRVRFGGWLIDNPGMREFQVVGCEQGVEDLFQDMFQLAKQCRFRDCQHTGDAGCALAAAVENGVLESRRLRSFLKLQSEQARNSETLADRRENDRKRGRFYKSIIEGKRKSREQD